MNIFRFYVYAYLREDHTPYYIGKGSNKRAYRKHIKIPVPKNKSLIVFLETNLSNVGSLALERRYIRWYGRKDNGTGILRNLSDGGEGSENHHVSEETKEFLRNRIVTEETRQKIRESHIGRIYGPFYPLTEEHKQKIRESCLGRKHSLETKERIGISNIGKHNKSYGPMTEEEKEKRRKANIGKKHTEKSKQKMSDGIKNGKPRGPRGPYKPRKIEEGDGI